MPTYVCSVLENSVDERQKDAIAEAIARVHSEETGCTQNSFVRSSSTRKSPPAGTLDHRAHQVRFGSEVTFVVGGR